MTEEQIAQKLKQNLPSEPAPVVPAVAATLTDEQSSITENAVNELGLLKLAHSLGLDFLPSNTESLDRLKFIYEQAAVLSPDNSHDSIMDAVNSLLLRLGFKYDQDKFMKLYLWLKLNQEKTAIEQEMVNL